MFILLEFWRTDTTELVSLPELMAPVGMHYCASWTILANLLHSAIQKEDSLVEKKEKNMLKIILDTK